MRATLLAILGAATGCAAHSSMGINVGRPMPIQGVCSDGAPPRLLLHPSCAPEGVCGYSCLPGRWETREGEGESCVKVGR
jgi:hypothetical protein